MEVSILKNTRKPRREGLAVSFSTDIPKQLCEYQEEFKSHPTGVVFRAIGEFKGDDEDDLSFSFNNLILVFDQGSSKEDWWEGVMDGRIGTFPGTFVTQMAYQPPDVSSFWFPPGMKPDEIAFAKTQRPVSPPKEEGAGKFLTLDNSEDADVDVDVDTDEPGLDRLSFVAGTTSSPPKDAHSDDTSDSDDTVNQNTQENAAAPSSISAHASSAPKTLTLGPSRVAPPPPNRGVFMNAEPAPAKDSDDEDAKVTIEVGPAAAAPPAAAIAGPVAVVGDVHRTGWMLKKGGGRLESGRMQGSLFARRNWKKRLISRNVSSVTHALFTRY